MLLVQLGAAVALLGGISTVLASYTAKVGGLGDPELSSIQTRESNSFFREVHTFIVDDGSFLSFGAFAGDLCSYRFLNSLVRTQGTSLEKNMMGKIMAYREQFEDIIETEGEDLGPLGLVAIRDCQLLSILLCTPLSQHASWLDTMARCLYNLDWVPMWWTRNRRCGGMRG